MSFLRLYFRVLALLAPEARLAITLAVANIALAVSQFVEPVLFGRIVDGLSGALPAGVDAAARALAPLIGAWVGFGLFIIVVGRAGRLVCRPAGASPPQHGDWRTISSTYCSCRWPFIPPPIRAGR